MKNNGTMTQNAECVTTYNVQECTRLSNVIDPLLLVGRVLLGTIFLLSGIMKLLNWSTVADHMTSEGMVAVPFFLASATLVEIVGGLSVILGFQGRIGALALALFLIPVTAIFHDFWTYQSPESENQMQHFLKNLTIIGGLLTLAVAGTGKLSLDSFFCRKEREKEQTQRFESVAVGR